MNREEIVEKILEIWQEVFNNKDIKTSDNFFVIGGDSLKAIKILELMKQRNIIEEIPSMKLIYSHLTINSMADYVVEISNEEVMEGEI
jgi:yersiniabactin nonribosomal peptide synthetase